MKSFTNFRFLLLLLLIIIFGFFLRLKDYDMVPSPYEDFDEVHYAWGGATWLKEGTPRSWSYLNSYKNSTEVERFGVKWKIVSPVIEKQPLYFWLSGANVNLLHGGEVFDVTHRTIRILPILLGIVTVFLTGTVAALVFGKNVGLISSLLFSTNPTIVLANRMSVTENLITPLLLGTLLTVLLFLKNKVTFKISLVTVALLSFLAMLTKQIGVTVGLAAATVYIANKKYLGGVIAFAAVGLSVLVYVLIGYLYDFSLWASLQNDVKVKTIAGLPEVINAIFAYPGISAKNRLFFDGGMLASIILFATSPFWISGDKKIKVNDPVFIFLVFPFMYLTLMVLGASGSGAFSYFNKYIYPLFPFSSILLAVFMAKLWKSLGFFEMLFLMLILGSTTIRFGFLFLGRQYHYLWQYTFLLAFMVFLVSWIFAKYRRIVITFYFIIFLMVNVLVVMNLIWIYPAETERLSDLLKLFR
ncbi:glycosyltransferase family 39 protein [Candidatus Curtissbacteria bacterium]|nr:glycosyltransferase family 39 protein [Candidatus Curtissbacteria bacterium]